MSHKSRRLVRENTFHSPGFVGRIGQIKEDKNILDTDVKSPGEAWLCQKLH
jgi:hypothetical protein